MENRTEELLRASILERNKQKDNVLQFVSGQMDQKSKRYSANGISYLIANIALTDFFDNDYNNFKSFAGNSEVFWFSNNDESKIIMWSLKYGFESEWEEKMD